MVTYDLPKWLLIVPLTLIGFAVQVDLKLARVTERETDTVLKNVSGEGDLGLSRGSQITVGIFALLFALIMFLWASTAPGNPYFNNLPGTFCLLVAGACLLPRGIRGFCGDIIAVMALGLVIGFLATSSWGEPGSNPIAFAVVYGGLSIAYLGKRYARHFGKRNT